MMLLRYFVLKWNKSFDAGENTIYPRRPGSYLILGVIPAHEEATSREVGLSPGC
jgi:hypothetical protein